MTIPYFIRLSNRKTVYAIALFCGGLGYISTMLFHNQYMLLFSMVGIGFAWAAILSIPYAILSGSLPAKRMGIYMGIFNLTVVIPQIISGLLEGTYLKDSLTNKLFTYWFCRLHHDSWCPCSAICKGCFRRTRKQYRRIGRTLVERCY